MGLTRALLVAVLAALVLAGSAGAGLRQGVLYLESRQAGSGGFAEPGRSAEVGLTAWTSLGLRAAGAWPSRRDAAADFLVGRTDASVTDLELRIMALAALDRGTGSLADRLAGKRQASGRIGPALNSTIWGILALRSAGRPAPRSSVRFVLRRQARNGGWSWQGGLQPDSNDTAAAIQALRSAGVASSSTAIKRGVAFLRRLQNRDGGFELTSGRGSDAPSTAWAIQALVAAGRAPGKAAFAYLGRLQRANGSYRYSKRYGIDPVWTTAQVVAALARKPFPLR
jgi:hypothetical protein